MWLQKRKKKAAFYKCHLLHVHFICILIRIFELIFIFGKGMEEGFLLGRTLNPIMSF